jgi:hypothetical protein
MKLIVETIKIDGRLPIPCDFEVCELDSSVRVTCKELLRDNRRSDVYDKTPLCTGHAHVVISESMVGL